MCAYLDTPVTQWLPALCDALQTRQPQVLVSVIATQGSAPRDAGARMWVGPDKTVGTIGGGHLEWRATADARALLARTDHAGLYVAGWLRYPLGPALGQCCGGAVWLMFERLQYDELGRLTELGAGLNAGNVASRSFTLPAIADQSDALSSQLPAHDVSPAWVFSAYSSEAVTPYFDSRTGRLNDVWEPDTDTIVVCGAGHVGTAVVRLLSNLPVHVVWLDPRQDCWPPDIPAYVTVVQGDQDEVPDMPEQALWLIMTHSHSLDLALIDAIFRHKPFRFLGLIGSRTKQARFHSQLRRRHGRQLADRVVCPVGLMATSDKRPAVIAVSIVAQLIQQLTAPVQ